MPYSLLIADDEPFVRYILRTIIDWESEGYMLVGEAEDGLSALRLLEDKKPDLVLLDIKMPGLNGVEIMRQAEALSLDSLVILVSGYAEFHYAQEVIRMTNAVDYLLKPVEMKDLKRAVTNANERLKGREKRSAALMDSNDWVGEILLAIDHTPLGDLRLGEIARRFGASPSHLSALLKKRLGMNFSEYLLRKRMERAEELLIHTSMRISDIGMHLGYRDALYFMKAFKKWSGVSPGQYRRNF